MERRVLLAFLLSFLVFLLFVRFFGSPPATEPPPGDAGQPAADSSFLAPSPGAPSSAPGDPSSTTEDSGAPSPPVEERAAESEQRITVRTPEYVAVLTNRGARLLGAALREHRDSLGAPYEMVPSGDESVLSVRPLDVVLPTSPAPERLNAVLHEVSVDGRPRTGPVTVELAGEPVEVEFRWAGADGLSSVKTLRFGAAPYRIEAEISVRQNGVELAKEILYGPGVGNEPPEGRYVSGEQGVIKSAGEIELYGIRDVSGGRASTLSAQAVGAASHYFTGLLVAEPGQRYEGRLETIEIPSDRFEVVPEDPTAPRVLTVARLATTGVASFSLYAGPRQLELLTDLGVDIVEFGSWLRYLVLPIRAALRWVHGYIGNWGWAIVLVTALINLLLVPLKHYSYRSIRGMQKISPQVQRIQERYRSMKVTDPRRSEMNREMMELYREHGVSPAGGCLPMLAMIPFFFAFYRLLVVSVELRHAPFGFWIQDLSREDPYFILPILMGVSQLAMQKMTPTTATGMQARIMMFLPIVFTLVLAWAPSGLVLYWFANNIFSMGQQVITARWMDRRDAASREVVVGKSPAARKKGGTPAKVVVPSRGPSSRGKSGGRRR